MKKSKSFDLDFLAPPAGLEPCDTVSQSETASLSFALQNSNVAQRNKLRNHDVLTVQAEQRKEKQKQTICDGLFLFEFRGQNDNFAKIAKIIASLINIKIIPLIFVLVNRFLKNNVKSSRNIAIS